MADAEDRLNVSLDDEQKEKLAPKVLEQLSKCMDASSISNDNELVQYVLLLVSNNRTKQHIASDLKDFCGQEGAERMVAWLWQTLKPSKASAVSQAVSAASNEAPSVKRKLSSVAVSSVSSSEADSSNRKRRVTATPEGASRLLKNAFGSVSSNSGSGPTGAPSGGFRVVVDNEPASAAPRKRERSDVVDSGGAKLFQRAVSRTSVSDDQSSAGNSSARGGDKPLTIKRKVSVQSAVVPRDEVAKNQELVAMSDGADDAVTSTVHVVKRPKVVRKVQAPGAAAAPEAKSASIVVRPPTAPMIVKKVARTKSRPIIIQEAEPSSADAGVPSAISSMKAQLLKKVRCTFWPQCTKGDACPFHHPSLPCKFFPNCTFGAKCMYIHPAGGSVATVEPATIGSTTGPANTAAAKTTSSASGPFTSAVSVLSGPSAIPCRFGARCTRGAECKFSHAVPASSGAGVASSAAAATATPIVCRYDETCNRISCRFAHPKRDARDAAFVGAKNGLVVDVAAAAAANGGLSSSLPDTPPHLKKNIAEAQAV